MPPPSKARAVVEVGRALDEAARIAAAPVTAADMLAGLAGEVGARAAPPHAVGPAAGLLAGGGRAAGVGARGGAPAAAAGASLAPLFPSGVDELAPPTAPPPAARTDGADRMGFLIREALLAAARAKARAAAGGGHLPLPLAASRPACAWCPSTGASPCWAAGTSTG